MNTLLIIAAAIAIFVWVYAGVSKRKKKKSGALMAGPRKNVLTLDHTSTLIVVAANDQVEVEEIVPYHGAIRVNIYNHSLYPKNFIVRVIEVDEYGSEITELKK